MLFKKDNKYFQWGLTIFLVVTACMGVYYCIFHIKSLLSILSKIIDILQPIINGIAMAYLFAPIMNYFENKLLNPIFAKSFDKHPKNRIVVRSISIFLTFTFVILIVYGFLALMLPQLYYSIENLVIQSNTYINNFIIWIEKISSVNPELYKYIQSLVVEYSGTFNETINIKILPQIETILKSVSIGAIGFLSLLLDFVIGLIISIYLLLGKERFIAQAKKVIYANFNTRKANLFIKDLRFSHKTFIGFLVGKIVDSFVIFMLCLIGTTVLNIPYAILISVIVGVTNVIPYFGPFIGAIPSAILVLVIEPKMCIVFIIFILGLQQLDGNVIGPKILGEYTGLTSFWVIFSIAIFGGVFGFTGMVIGVPAFAVIYAFCKRSLVKKLHKKGLKSETEKYINLNEINSEEEYIYFEKQVKQGEKLTK